MKTEEQTRLDSIKEGPGSQCKKILQEQWVSLGVMVVPSEQEYEK